jgi:hypothetical protein
MLRHAAGLWTSTLHAEPRCMPYGTPEWERIPTAVRASLLLYPSASVRTSPVRGSACVRACVRLSACAVAGSDLVRAQRKQDRISEFARARARVRACAARPHMLCAGSGGLLGLGPRARDAAVGRASPERVQRPSRMERASRTARTHEQSPRARATRGPIADALLNQFGSHAALRAQPRHAGMDGGLHLRRGSFGPRGRAGAALGRSTRSTRSCTSLPVRYLAVDTDG